MEKLLQKAVMYCDALKEGVACDLIRDSFLDMHADVYKCPKFNSGEPPCNPCSSYYRGLFIPVPDKVVRKGGRLNFEKWAKAINATIEIAGGVEMPVAEYNRLIMAGSNKI